jgi:hypothetical protein
MAIVRTGKAPHQVRDIGPAAGGAVDGLAAIGRVFATKGATFLEADRAQAMGAGPIERRHVDGSATPPPTPRTEEPVATPAEPCSTCLHAPVCRLRAMLADLGALEPVQVIDDGLRVVATGYRIECDHYLAGPRPVLAPSPDTGTAEPLVKSATAMAQASRQRGANARRKLAQQRASDDQVIDALRRSEGDKEMAGRACGITGTAIAFRVKNLRAHGALPGDVEALLSARRVGRWKAVAS